MESNQAKQILDAFLVVVRPIIRILLRYGIGFKEFSEVLKIAYVDVASSDFGIRGRPTNISRVAVMTGLTRKEVRRLKDRIASPGEPLKIKATPLADVLHHWLSQDEFTTSTGEPKTLPYLGNSGSFTSLVRRFGGDIPAGAMRTEMKRVGAVTENTDGTLSATKRTYKPAEDHDNLVTSLIHSVYPVLANTVYNTDPARSGEAWANRVAFTQSLKSSENRRLRRVARDRIAEFVESVDDIFMSFEALHGDEESKEKDGVIAVGVYYFEEIDKNANYDW